MLKKLLLNGTEVPIPVPVKTLAESLNWLAETLIKPNHSITSVQLDGKDIDLDSERSWPTRTLHAESELAVRVESPLQLAVQSLDTIRTLALAIHGVLQGMAVHLWEYTETDIPRHLDGLRSDIDLLMELDTHLRALMDAGIIDLAPVQANCRLSRRVGLALQKSLEEKQWQDAARILLNRLEPIVKDLAVESETIQIQLIAQGYVEPSFAKLGSL